MRAALRLARQQHRAFPHRSVRSLTTTANHVGADSSSASSSSPAPAKTVPLSNVEAAWAKMSDPEKLTIQEQLEEIQKRDWKTLSIDEKKAAYYVAFGPHGPRAPTSQPGDGVKIFFWTVALVGVAGVLMLGIRSIAPPPPKTMTKEWEEATNARALEMKLNPITGISSEGYSGKGFVQSK